jgi:hypothetical protein
MRCGKCGAAMLGNRGGYRYRYYMCGNARREGREVCASPILRKDKVGGFVIGRVKGYILTEENLEELVRLTNEELLGLWLPSCTVVNYVTKPRRKVVEFANRSCQLTSK